MIRISLVLATTIALLFGARAASAPTWQASVQISSGERALGPELALNGAGHGLVVWDQEVGADCLRDPASTFCVHIVQAATRPAASSSWQPPIELSRPGVGAEPRSAIGAAGDATVAWVHDIGEDRVLQATYRHGPSGSFPDPNDISEVVRAVRNHRVAVDGRGNAVVAWAERPPTQELFDVAVAVRSASSGAWSAKTRLSSLAGRSAAGPELVAAPNGVALVAWIEIDGTLRAAGGDLERGTWDPPVDIARGAQAAGGLHVAANSAGDAVVVWVGEAGGTGDVRAAFRARAGTWGQTVSLGAARASSPPEPRVAITSAGDVVAAWLAPEGVTAATRSSTGAWRTSLVLESRAASSLQLAVVDSGNAVVAWTRTTDGVVEASLRPAGLGDWLPQTPISAARSSRLRLALDDAQKAVATWNREDGQRVVVEVSELGARGPVLARLVVPEPAIVVGRRGRFSVRAAPWAAPLVGPPKWSFGDGGSAAGRSVTHAFSRAGRFRVTVTQADESGDTSAASVTARVVATRVRNLQRPRIEGRALVGGTLFCQRGRWSGSPPLRYTYSWRRDGRPICARTAPRLRLRMRDRGSLVSCVVAASNPASSVRAASAPVAVR